MRLLRDFPEAQLAELVRDALQDSGIDSEVKRAHNGQYALWVLDESHLIRAQGLAARWLDQDDAAAFEEAARRGRIERELKARIELRSSQQMQAIAERLRAMPRRRPTPLTVGLIALCVGVALLTELGDNREMVLALTIADPRATIPALPLPFAPQLTWLSLPWHEPWRLITPVLVHFGIFHIFFNLLVLRDLGRVVESVHGARYLAAFVLVSGVVSNVAQYQLAQSPLFAGMSGVVYGLLGLIWVRGKLDPRVGYGLTKGTVQFMLIWLALGFIGNFHIANWCHLFGLLVGASWAWVASRLGATPRA